MKKALIIILSFLAHLTTNAQEGIEFQHCDWKQVVEIAQKEQKLIFVDVYTQWCGPCYNMAKSVFPLYSVGTFYNNNFVSYKLDAENGEGIELAKKYKVSSYPTYLFIDPQNEEVVHRSSSRQEPQTFIYTGKCALDPEKRSFFLEQEIEKGTRNPEILLNYALYKGSVYDSKTPASICEQLLKIEGYDLANPAVWNLFIKYVKGVESVPFQILLSNITQYVRLYGQSAVDDKLYEECRFIREPQKVASFPDFEGKIQLIQVTEAQNALYSRDFDKAGAMADSLMKYRGRRYDDVMNSLYYIARSDEYGEYPLQWHEKCLELSRYVAYNSTNRDDAAIHQDYAVHLEMKLKRMGSALDTPAFGNVEYSMRPVDLKKKPVRKQAE